MDPECASGVAVCNKAELGGDHWRDALPGDSRTQLPFPAVTGG